MVLPTSLPKPPMHAHMLSSKVLILVHFNTYLRFCCVQDTTGILCTSLQQHAADNMVLAQTVTCTHPTMLWYTLEPHSTFVNTQQKNPRYEHTHYTRNVNSLFRKVVGHDYLQSHTSNVNDSINNRISISAHNSSSIQ